MRFFFDSCTSPRIARAIRALTPSKHEVFHISETRFKHYTDDVVWISGLSGEGDWTIVSADNRIRVNADELKAWQEGELPDGKRRDQAIRQASGKRLQYERPAA